MEIEIIVFKNSGKYYTSETVYSEQDIPMYKDEEFKQFIRDHNPANIGEGYIITKDTDRFNTGFHIALWRYNEIYK